MKCNACAGSGEDFNEGDPCHECGGSGDSDNKLPRKTVFDYIHDQVKKEMAEAYRIFGVKG